MPLSHTVQASIRFKQILELARNLTHSPTNSVSIGLIRWLHGSSFWQGLKTPFTSPDAIREGSISIDAAPHHSLRSKYTIYYEVRIFDRRLHKDVRC